MKQEAQKELDAMFEGLGLSNDIEGEKESKLDKKEQNSDAKLAKLLDKNVKKKKVRFEASTAANHPRKRDQDDFYGAEDDDEDCEPGLDYQKEMDKLAEAKYGRDDE